MKHFNKLINESEKSIYDVFGNSMKIGDTVVFYFENGELSKEEKS